MIKKIMVKETISICVVVAMLFSIGTVTQKVEAKTTLTGFYVSQASWTLGEVPPLPSVTPEHPEGAVPMYSYCSTEKGTYTAVVPTTAGTYYIKATFEKSKSYFGLETPPCAFTIFPPKVAGAMSDYEIWLDKHELVDGSNDVGEFDLNKNGKIDEEDFTIWLVAEENPVVPTPTPTPTPTVTPTPTGNNGNNGNGNGNSGNNGNGNGNSGNNGNGNGNSGNNGNGNGNSGNNGNGVDGNPGGGAALNGNNGNPESGNPGNNGNPPGNNDKEDEPEIPGGNGGGGGGGGKDDEVGGIKEFGKGAAIGDEDPGAHSWYIAGYEDGEVRPSSNLTRQEFAVMLYRLMVTSDREKYETREHGFSDIERGGWGEVPIATLVNAGLLYGYEDGEFRPNNPITRAEIATICSRLGNGLLAETVVIEQYIDVSEDFWAYNEIIWVTERGWMRGVWGEEFVPDAYITRAETATTLNRILDRPDTFLSEKFKDYPDLFSSHWAYLQLQEASVAHEYTIENKLEIWK